MMQDDAWPCVCELTSMYVVTRILLLGHTASHVRPSLSCAYMICPRVVLSLYHIVIITHDQGSCARCCYRDMADLLLNDPVEDTEDEVFRDNKTFTLTRPYIEKQSCCS